MPCYGDAQTLADIRTTFQLCLRSGDAERRRPAAARAAARSIGPFGVGDSGSRSRFRCGTATRPILGFRFGRFAYLTDCNRHPRRGLAAARRLDVLVLDALRERPHPTHFSLARRSTAARRIGAARTLLHAHVPRSPHAPTNARLPDGIALAYDGLVLDI